MTVPMVQIGVVRVPVHEADVPMPMRMRLAGRIGCGVPVLMVLVVTVPVLVLHGFVQMFMLVPFSDVEPQAKAHQPAGDHELRR